MPNEITHINALRYRSFNFTTPATFELFATFSRTIVFTEGERSQPNFQQPQAPPQNNFMISCRCLHSPTIREKSNSETLCEASFDRSKLRHPFRLSFKWVYFTSKHVKHLENAKFRKLKWDVNELTWNIHNISTILICNVSLNYIYIISWYSQCNRIIFNSYISSSKNQLRDSRIATRRPYLFASLVLCNLEYWNYVRASASQRRAIAGLYRVTRAYDTSSESS